MSNEQKLERFGRYLILDHLVDGGMAKICRARFLGEQADKVVAIKMIQPQYSADSNFKKMFMDEIKVTFGLIHPNIAQTYDYGVLGDQLYTAMEYIDGANLKQFMDRLKSKNFVFPVEISIHIISQVCQGLTYAHNFTDKLTGKAGGIIHRDISPHNIMLTYDGAVKIIDFGIAKAESNSESTKAGTIKGKLSYLAPEYLEGVELDHRYDQFAVGITLWELLCCRKLFNANNELAVLKLIQACKIPPPSSINPNVSKELDQIVMKALSKDRELRFKDMDQFNRALVKFLYAQYPDFNPLDLAAFSKELFKDEIKIDRAKLIEFGKIDITPYLEAFKADGQRGNNNSNSNNNSNNNNSSGEKSGLHLRDEARKEIDLGVENVPSAKLKKDGTIVMDKGTSNLLNKKGNTSASKSPQSSQTIQIQKESLPRNKNPGTTVAATVARQVVNNKVTPRKSSGNKTGFIEASPSLADKKAPTSVVFLTIVAVFGIVFYLQKDALTQIFNELIGNNKVTVNTNQIPKTDNVENRSPSGVKSKSEEFGIVQLNGLDYLMEIFVNNKKVEYEGFGLKVPLNRQVTITIRKKGTKDFSQVINLNAANHKIKIDIPEMARTIEGVLYSSNNYKPGTIISIEVNGKKEERDLPIQDWRLPAGSYTAKVRNEFYGTEKVISFDIFENKRVLLPSE